jgi:hypothetical protein
VGTVLTAAALIDDVVALVLLSCPRSPFLAPLYSSNSAFFCIFSIVSSLGRDRDADLSWTIGRPVVASFLLAIISPVVSYLFLGRLYPKYWEPHILRWGDKAALLVGICVLLAHVAVYVPELGLGYGIFSELR